MKVIGIDLGTSSVCVTYVDSCGKIQVITDSSSNVTIPSLVDVTLSEDGIINVGNEINKSRIDYNKNIFHSFKRLIGHDISDLETTNLLEILTYDIIQESNVIMCKDTNNRLYDLSEVIYLLLKYIKSLIIQHLKDEEWECIVTLPAYFNEIQRRITMTAITMANLPLKTLLNEPLSASFAYLYHNNYFHLESFQKKILVIDYGAGTLDLTVLEIIKDEDISNIHYEVLGIYGDNNFGGIDITKKICKTLFLNDTNYDMTLKMKIAEEIKLMLLKQSDVEYYSSTLNKTFYYSYEVFVNQLKEFEEHIINLVTEVLKVADVLQDDIDDIVLVGGSFKIPYFRKAVNEYFKKISHQVKIKINKQEYYLYEDLAVSFGASIYGYYSNMTNSIILIDRLPLSIGIETNDKHIVKIVERNSTIPVSRKKIFIPETENQEYIDINIYQGESLYKDNCYHIGSFKLTNLPLGKPIIFVHVSVDSNGLITVLATDKGHRTTSEIVIDNKNIALSDSEIDKVIQKYETNIVNEIFHKQLLNAYYSLLNDLDTLSYQLNINTMLNLDEDVKNIIKEDIKLIIDKLLNGHVIKKYKINTMLISKIIILNDFTDIEKRESSEMNNDSIEDYIDTLKDLKTYIVDRYDIYIVNSYNMVSANQVAKQETLNDNDDNIDKDHVSFNETYDDIAKTIIDFKTKINRENITKTDYSIQDYLELVNWLEENINSLGLSEKAIEMLRVKLNEQVINDSYADAINNINEFCISLQTI